jgi:hypothetical protein
MLSLGRSKVLAALGLILTLAIATVALVTQMRPARASSSAIAPWSDSLAEYGMPTSPTSWQPSNWDVQIHTRDRYPGDGIDPHMADHGADCGAPPAQHLISTWQQAVFVCHNHVMTAIADEGYGMVTLTPDHMADWSNGPVTIGFSVSTQKLSQRDWWALDITPFNEQLALPFDDGGVDLQGMPAHYIEVRLDNCGNDAVFRVVRESSATGDDGSFGAQQSVSDCFQSETGIKPSAVTRTPFELVVSQTGYIFRVAASSPVGGGVVLDQGNWTKPLTFSQGVVQFSHHSYNPAKCDGCSANTWHWSNFSISSAVPYTLLRPTDQQVVAQPGGAITFGAPAPAGSFLKFAAIGSVQVSYDGGKTYSAAQKPPMDASLLHDEHSTSYLTPVPAGTRSVQLKLAGGWYGSGLARDFSIVSQTANGSQPPTQPPGPQPTATQPPGSTPIPLNNTPCMVEINGAMQNGTCNGTFNPSK